MEKEDIVKNFPEDIRRALEIELPPFMPRKFENIIVCGMGGSGIPGEIASDMLKKELKIPLSVVKSNHLPEHVNEKSLVFIISYSGNTFETISCFEEAKRKKAFVVVITSGGKLEELAEKEIIPIAFVPKNYEPRLAIPFQFFLMLRILARLGVIGNKDREILRTSKLVKRLENRAKIEAEQLAKDLKNKIPLFYASDSIQSSAYVLKIQIIETAKKPAFSNKFTELFHNEIEVLPLSNFLPILLIEEKNRKIKKQVKFFKKMLKNYYEFPDLSLDSLTRIFLIIYFGELLSFKLAEILKKDPREYVHIEDLKKVG